MHRYKDMKYFFCFLRYKANCISYLYLNKSTILSWCTLNMLSKAILNQIGIAFEKAKSKTKIKKQTNKKKTKKKNQNRMTQNKNLVSKRVSIRWTPKSFEDEVEMSELCSRSDN